MAPTTSTTPPWSEYDERRRLSSLAGGDEPRLFTCWIGQTTDELAHALTKYRGLLDDPSVALLRADLVDVVEDLETEIGYRTEHENAGAVAS